MTLNRIGAIAAAIAATACTFGQSSAGYEVSKTWAQLPAGVEWGQASAAASDGKGSIVVITRSDPPFLVLTTQGKFLKSWGDGKLFKNAHSVYVDRDGFVWATDNADHVVYKFSAGGKLLMTLGKRGVAGDNSSEDTFNRPSDVLVAPNGDIFVTDGYGNSRIMKFSGDGKFLKIIGGTKGSDPGQFNLPHAVVMDSKGRLVVADELNNRIQVLDQDGTFVEQWTGFDKPTGLAIAKDDTLYVGATEAATITIVKNGKPVGVIRDVGRAHWLDMDPDGALYVADPRNHMVSKIAKR